MKEIEINNSNLNESIKGYLFEGKSKELLIFVGGDTDTRDTFKDLSETVFEELNQDTLAFSFRGYESGILSPKQSLVDDLKEVIEYIQTNLNYSSLILVPTSSGAYPSVFCITDENSSQMISKTIFLDPADYYCTEEGFGKYSDTWNGFQEYNPEYPTASSLLKNLNSNVKVSVVFFSLRNSDSTSYVHKEYHLRGIDYPGKFPRLSKGMVESFWTNTPEKNRAKYVENNKIPHAFKRDGDIEANTKEIISILKEIRD